MRIPIGVLRMIPLGEATGPMNDSNGIPMASSGFPVGFPWTPLEFLRIPRDS